MSDCLFCQIVAGSIPSQNVYDDADVMAFLDIRPINPGHTLVIPKRHAENMLVSSDEDLVKVMGVIKKITPAILRAVGAEAFNLGCNTGRAAGQVVFHTHIHIMPRLATDGYRLWHPREDVPSDLNGIAEKIRKEIEKT